MDASRFELQRDLAQAARKMETVPIPRLRLRVTATAESLIRSGHPWLFAEGIREETALADLANWRSFSIGTTGFWPSVYLIPSRLSASGVASGALS
jgi:hypothetical protein